MISNAPPTTVTANGQTLDFLDSGGAHGVKMGVVPGGTNGFQINQINNNNIDLLAQAVLVLRIAPGLVELAGMLQNNVAANEAATATAGAIASPGNFQGFLAFKDSGGTTRKIPYFAN